MRQSIVLAASVVAFALPRIAGAQTPSVTPTPAPIALSVRFDCASVPWSCGDGPSDVRWQLYEAIDCNAGRRACRYEHLGPVLPGQVLTLWRWHRYKLFLAPNLDVSDRKSRECPVVFSAEDAYLVIDSMCAINEAACKGPENWQFYLPIGAGMVPGLKHIGNCSNHRLTVAPNGRVLHWGLPGELATATVPATTPTAPGITATDSPSPTFTMAPPTPPTPTPTAPPVSPPTKTVSPTVTLALTGTPTRASLLLPILWK